MLLSVSARGDDLKWAWVCSGPHQGSRRAMDHNNGQNVSMPRASLPIASSPTWPPAAGYDNIKRYWVVKNSWGPEFGIQGFMKVAYDAIETRIMEPSDT